MTPLGLAPGHCREAVDRYRDRVADLARSVAATAPAGGRPAASRLLLDEFADRIEVDTLSRSGPGAARMTRVEAEVFVPVVVQLREHLRSLSRIPPGPGWSPVLGEMDAALASANLALASWQARIT